MNLATFIQIKPPLQSGMGRTTQHMNFMLYEFYASLKGRLCQDNCVLGKTNKQNPKVVVSIFDSPLDHYLSFLGLK